MSQFSRRKNALCCLICFACLSSTVCFSLGTHVSSRAVQNWFGPLPVFHKVPSGVDSRRRPTSWLLATEEEYNIPTADDDQVGDRALGEIQPSEQRRELHKFIQQIDPSWYQEFVTSVLEDKSVQSFPSTLQYRKRKKKQQLKVSETAEVVRDDAQNEVSQQQGYQANVKSNETSTQLIGNTTDDGERDESDEQEVPTISAALQGSRLATFSTEPTYFKPIVAPENACDDSHEDSSANVTSQSLNFEESISTKTNLVIPEEAKGSNSVVDSIGNTTMEQANNDSQRNPATVGERLAGKIQEYNPNQLSTIETLKPNNGDDEKKSLEEVDLGISNNDDDSMGDKKTTQMHDAEKNPRLETERLATKSEKITKTSSTVEQVVRDRFEDDQSLEVTPYNSTQGKSNANKTTTNEDIKLSETSKPLLVSNRGVEEGKSGVIVFRDTKKGWDLVEIETLTQLGYYTQEAKDLLPDALAIILQEKIRRPRTLGLPSQWIARSESDRKNVMVLPDITAARSLLSKLTAEESKKSDEIWEARVRRYPANESPPNQTNLNSLRNRTLDQKLPEESRRVSKGEKSARTPESIDDRTPPLSAASTTSADLVQRYPKRSFSDELDRNQTNEEETTKTTFTVDAVTTSRKVFKRFPDQHVEQPPTFADEENTAIGDRADQEEEPRYEGRVVLYRDFGNALTAVPLSNLIDLGYEEQELLTLKAEALGIIIVDSVTRPRFGIPPQWKLADLKAGAEIDLVDTMEEAESRTEEDRTNRRPRKAVEIESLRSKRVNGDTNDSDGNPRDDSRKRRPKSTPDIGFPPLSSDDRKIAAESKRQGSPKPEDAHFNVERPRPRRSTGQTTPERSPASSSDGERSRRRSRRRDQNNDGSPKRIYNAREIPNRREAPARSDPPDPNSPLWINIDTFRDLLRSEARLRLQVLGEDWAPTIKQESDWRLDMYKKWLWTLHDGVGESIVPPSRYQRARKLKEKRERSADFDDDDGMETSATRKKPTRRPRDRR